LTRAPSSAIDSQDLCIEAEAAPVHVRDAK